MSDDGGTTARVVALGRELRRLHERIRECLDDVLAGADPTVALLDVTADPIGRCRTFCTVLDAHHRQEDATLFPWLLARRPDLAAVVVRLEEDHRLVGALLGELATDVTRHAPPEVLARHLEGLDAVLENHFRFEERQLVPVLDALSGDGPGPALGDAFWEP
ncbi:hemerythrin domain-containing protein [Phycicoccus flavus]|uniref:Hemerythrin domain-containing protein n=1 Tax=Phycicoccus flavus TaxID=2502783 RepID=A0A8T6R6D9_9MICO|nr:hemerythrin domain-containing protein [Phycicoccus flavus]NHA69133.1 hemerythrin domain-containing protein [Phycicoccus flavus]